MFDQEILHKLLNYAFVKIQTQQARNINAAVFLQRNYFAKDVLREALHQIQLILLFFFKIC